MVVGCGSRAQARESECGRQFSQRSSAAAEAKHRTKGNTDTLLELPELQLRIT